MLPIKCYQQSVIFEFICFVFSRFPHLNFYAFDLTFQDFIFANCQTSRYTVHSGTYFSQKKIKPGRGREQLIVSYSYISQDFELIK